MHAKPVTAYVIVSNPMQRQLEVKKVRKATRVEQFGKGKGHQR